MSCDHRVTRPDACLLKKQVINLQILKKTPGQKYIDSKISRQGSMNVPQILLASFMVTKLTRVIDIGIFNPKIIFNEKTKNFAVNFV
jgi:hypothetical protein